MLIIKQHRNLVRAISEKAQIPSDDLAPYISSVMTSFLAGIASPMELEEKFYTITVDPKNSWLHSMGADFAEEFINLHGFFCKGKEVAFGLAMLHLKDKLDKIPPAIVTDSEHDATVMTPVVRRPSFSEPLFSVGPLSILGPKSEKKKQLMIKKALSGISASSGDKKALKKLNSISYDQKTLRLTHQENERLNEVKLLDVEPLKKLGPATSLIKKGMIEGGQPVNSKSPRWQPVLPTLNGLCKHIQDVLHHVFAVKMRLFELQTALASAFNTSWNVLCANELESYKIFNVMFSNIDTHRSHVRRAFSTPPIEGANVMYGRFRDEEEIHFSWNSSFPEMVSIKGLIPDYGESGVGYKTALNIEPFLTDEARKILLNAWKETWPADWQ